MKLKCPLCMGLSFASEETLLHSLLSFASMNIACPLCVQVLRGSDKFTIHLCSHVFNLKSNGTVQLVQDARTNVVSLNEILENIHLDGPTESVEPLQKMQTETVIDDSSTESKNSTWSDASVPVYSNFELTRTHKSEVQEKISSCHPNMNAPTAPRQDHESKMPQSPLEATPVTCPQVLQKPYGVQLALQASQNSNIMMESSSLAFCEVAEPVPLPEVDDFFKNFEFLFNVEDPFAKLKTSQTEIFASTFTPSNFHVADEGDPGGNDANSNTPSSSPHPPVFCEICSLTFPDSNILSLHKELVHEKADKSQSVKSKFQCELCKRKFKLKASLLAHQQVAHAVENGARLLDANQNDENFQFHCTLCSKIFKKENYLIQHMKTHEEKQWTCDECGKIFATKHFLQNHKRLHTGEMPYICSICNKQFTFQQSYHRHIAYHNSEKPHRCRECGKSFKELSTLYNHQRIHTGEKPFSCEVCGKSFRQRVTCLMHSRIHSNTKEFKCTKCQKSFRYKISLRSHKCVHSTATVSPDVLSLQQ